MPTQNKKKVTKKCPFASKNGEFVDCIKDKCALWVDTTLEEPTVYTWSDIAGKEHQEIKYHTVHYRTCALKVLALKNML